MLDCVAGRRGAIDSNTRGSVVGDRVGVGGAGAADRVVARAFVDIDAEVLGTERDAAGDIGADVIALDSVVARPTAHEPDAAPAAVRPAPEPRRDDRLHDEGLVNG